MSNARSMPPMQRERNGGERRRLNGGDPCKIADRIEDNLELLAHVETRDNGKPIRETLNADVPLAADHFRYFAGCIRAEEGTLGEIDRDTVAYHFREPLGVVGQIIPWNFPLLMAAWKLAPALAAGNCVVVKPASDTPMSLAVLMDLIGDLLPAGVLNVVFGHGSEVGGPLAQSPRIAKIAFIGETTMGRQIMHYAEKSSIQMLDRHIGRVPVGNRTSHSRLRHMQDGAGHPPLMRTFLPTFSAESRGVIRCQCPPPRQDKLHRGLCAP